MPRFDFRLAAVLKVREATRDERRGDLTAALEVQQTLRNRRQAIEQELDELAKLCHQVARPGRVDVGRLRDASRYEVLLRARRTALEQQEASLSVVIEQHREALVVADREVRILTKLREKKYAAHYRLAAVEEMKQLDEIAARHTTRETSF